MFRLWFYNSSDEYFCFDELAEYSEKYDFNASDLVRKGKTEMLAYSGLYSQIGGVECVNHQGFSRALSLCLES